jgi:hypothetical protein
MASLDEIAAGARTMLRDFPLYFEVDNGPLNTLSIRLPHPLISDKTLGVYVMETTTPPPYTPVLTSAWQLDARNGILKMTNTADLGKQVIISGYHYSWFLDSDLAFYAEQVWSEMTYYDDLVLTRLEPAQAEVVQLGVVVHALWSLILELSLDIDVSTPEGMFIPAHQRYQQVLQMMQYYEAQYAEKAGMLNMGLGALTQFKLRRVAYMTGRYVPVYKDREVDDPRPPQRQFPQIPAGTHAAAASGDVVEQFIAGEISVAAATGEDLGYNGGWRSIGTRG